MLLFQGDKLQPSDQRLLMADEGGSAWSSPTSITPDHVLCGEVWRRWVSDRTIQNFEPCESKEQALSDLGRRDLIAGMALQGMLSNPCLDPIEKTDGAAATIAEDARRFADALLTALDAAQPSGDQDSSAGEEAAHA